MTIEEQVAKISAMISEAGTAKSFTRHPTDDSLMIGDNGHVYPATRLPQTQGWAHQVAYEIMDTLKPAVVSEDARLLLTGLIAGRLERQTSATSVLDCINEATTAPPPPAVAFDPGNYLGRIETIWAALSVDDGGEGVCAAPFGAMTLPLIAADKRRLDQIIPRARAIASVFKKPVRLAKFTKREDVEIFRP